MEARRPQRRTTPRTEVAVGCTLSRHRGGPIAGSTVDVGGGGMRVRTDRPLAVDEVLRFDLPLNGSEQPLQGGVRVLREQARNVYALRFEGLTPAQADAILAWVSGAETS